MKIDTGSAVSIISDGLWNVILTGTARGYSCRAKNLYRSAHPSQRTVSGLSYIWRSDCWLSTFSFKREGYFTVWGKLAWTNKTQLKNDHNRWSTVSECAQPPEPPKWIPEVITKCSDIFRDEFGTLKYIKAAISVKPEATPKCHKARPLPFAMKEKVKKRTWEPHCLLPNLSTNKEMKRKIDERKLGCQIITT